MSLIDITLVLILRNILLNHYQVIKHQYTHPTCMLGARSLSRVGVSEGNLDDALLLWRRASCCQRLWAFRMPTLP